MHRRQIALLPLPLLFVVIALPAKASLVGSSVTGSLTFAGDPSNYFDPGYGFVPPGYLNTSGTTVTISGNSVEFGYNDGGSLISANFSDNQLTVADLIEMAGPNNGFQMTFTDTAFAGEYLIRGSDTFPVSDYSLAGDEITLHYAGGNPALGQTVGASFTLAAIPEPSTLGLGFLSGLGSLAAVLMRKSRLRFLQS